MNQLSFLDGPWREVTGLNAPLFDFCYDETEESKMYNVNASINYYLDQGAPRSKLVMGIPLYGRSFTLLDRLWTDINSPIKGSGFYGPYTLTKGFVAYNEVRIRPASLEKKRLLMSLSLVLRGT